MIIFLKIYLFTLILNLVVGRFEILGNSRIFLSILSTSGRGLRPYCQVETKAAGLVQIHSLVRLRPITVL